MKIFVYFQDNYIQKISPIKEDPMFDEYEVSDPDFLGNYRFYTLGSSGKLELNPIYKKLEPLEYLIYEMEDGTLTLLKPYIEAADANFIKFDTDEEANEVMSHLNHYYIFNKTTGTLEIDADKLDTYQENFHVVEFKKYRAEYFGKWDIVKTNSLIGLADPITEEEKQWYLEMLSFPENITKDSTPETWPVIPDRFK